MRWVALLLALGLVACDDETTLPGAPLGWGPASGTLYAPPSASGIGAWRAITSAECGMGSGAGFEFRSDGAYGLLNFPCPAPEGDCSIWPLGYYVRTGSVLLFTFIGAPAEVAVDGDRAVADFTVDGEHRRCELERISEAPLPLCPDTCGWSM
jgi:hypothetical protein